MSSQNKNMAQKVLTEVLKYYNVIPPAIQHATNAHFLQELALDLPQGIPALHAFSKRHGNDFGLEKAVTKILLGRYAGAVLELRMVVIACGLIYLSRPIVGPILSSAWEEMSQDVEELWTGRPVSSCMVETYDPESRTVSMTVAELKELNGYADAIQARLDASKELQGDMLTRNCELEDEVEDLEDEVEILKKQSEDDTAHFNARIRALNDQIDIEKDSRETVWTERERYREGGKELKTQLDNLQAQYNALEDNRDDCRERVEETQGQLDNMTSARDNLQVQVGQLQTDNQVLESSLAQKDNEVADATNTLASLKTQIESASSEDLGTKMRAVVEQEKREGEMQGLRRANANLEIDIQALRSAAEDQKEAAVEYQETCDGLEAEVVGLKRDLRVAGGEMAGLRAEIAALKDRLQSQNSDEGEDFGPKPSGSPPAIESSPSIASSPPVEPSTPMKASPPKESSTPTTFNASASEFRPLTGASMTAPPILPTHQAYFASLVGIETPAAGPSTLVPAGSPIESAESPGEPLPTYSPAPKAAGPGAAKNAHVRKLNEEVMRKAWRRQSGMPDVDEEIILAPEDEFEIGT